MAAHHSLEATLPTGIESFIALRYLRGAQGKSEGRRFLRLVTYISIGGVALGVAALVLSLAIVRGFSGGIKEKIVGFGAHVQVESLRDAPLDDAGPIIEAVENETGVAHVSSVVQEFVLLKRRGAAIEGVSLTGMDRLPPYLSQNLTAGHARLDSSSTDKPGMLVGAALARILDIRPGDTLTAFSVRTASRSEGIQPPRVKQFVVTGLYQTSLADFDELYVYTGIDQARDLLSYRSHQVSRLDVTLEEGLDWDEAAERIDAAVDFPAMATPISDVFRPLFAWIALQENIIPLLISIIVFVAAVNIIGTLMMIILEKTHEIGVLAGIGASRRMLVRIFLRLGFYIGVVGIVLGEFIALVLALLQQRFGIIPLPAEAYYMSEAPIDMGAVDFVVVAVFTLILCTASAWIPARYAARVEPLNAIHLR